MTKHQTQAKMNRFQLISIETAFQKISSVDDDQNILKLLTPTDHANLFFKNYLKNMKILKLFLLTSAIKYLLFFCNSVYKQKLIARWMNALILIPPVKRVKHNTLRTRNVSSIISSNNHYDYSTLEVASIYFHYDCNTVKQN